MHPWLGRSSPYSFDRNISNHSPHFFKGVLDDCTRPCRRWGHQIPDTGCQAVIPSRDTENETFRNWYTLSYVSPFSSHLASCVNCLCSSDHRGYFVIVEPLTHHPRKIRPPGTVRCNVDQRYWLLSKRMAFGIEGKGGPPTNLDRLVQLALRQSSGAHDLG
jgi:hypothetical protein